MSDTGPSGAALRERRAAAAAERRITVALAGNPNSGKTTIFNNLTGARQHVGNYPGVTVEKKEGHFRHDGWDVDVVDLPGTYSLTAYSIEEVIARNFVIDERPDVVVDIVDASNLERNLYLATQFMELGTPLILAFNMSDMAASRGFDIDTGLLSRLLGVGIVPTVGHRGRGMDALKDAIVQVADDDAPKPAAISYGTEVERELARIVPLIEKESALTARFDARWLAVKLLENDGEVRAAVNDLASDAAPILAAVEAASRRIERDFGDTPEIVIADRRYGFISGACQEAVRATVEARHTMSDRIDSVVTNRLLGIPIFLGLMYLVFKLTFSLGDPPMGWIEGFFGWLGGVVTTWWPKGSESALMSLLVDGLIGGVGGVLVFLPNILLLFLAIAFLEDTGYMARAAFIMDRLMHKIGLHGKSFIPLLLGFGCTIPAIMATRTLETRRDRLTTMLVAPLMSCGARLPIYALIIPAFFPGWLHAPMLWLIYLIGVLLAIVSAKVLRTTLFKGESAPFVMELPPYRIPTLKGVTIHMWERAWLYVKKAGTIILGISILLWAMTSYPKKNAFDRDYEAEAAQAEAAYIAGVRGLNADLGLAANSETVAAAVQAELDMLATQENYHENEAGFAEAEQEREARLDALKRAPDGPVLARFLDIREAVQAARAAFESALEEREIEAPAPDEKPSPATSALLQERDAALAKAERTDPTVYAAVVKYLDEVRAPFDETNTEIEQAQQGEELAYSVAGRVGHGLGPVLRPMGFDWRIGTALIGAFGAKEVFVAQMGIVHAVGEADEESDPLRSRLRENYTPLIGFCIMLFCLVSAPCMATIAVTKRESNSWKWALFQLGALTALAWVLTTAVFQVGRLLGIGVA